MDATTFAQLDSLSKEILNRISPKSHANMNLYQRLEFVKQLKSVLKKQSETKISVVYNYYTFSNPQINVVDAYFDENEARQMILESEKLNQKRNYYLAIGTIKDFEDGMTTHKNTPAIIMQGLNRMTIYMSLMEKIL